MIPGLKLPEREDRLSLKIYFDGLFVWIMFALCEGCWIIKKSQLGIKGGMKLMKMKYFKFTSFLLGAVVFLLMVSGVAAKEAKVAQNISVMEAFALLESGESAIYLIDVRTPAEYQQIGHAVMAYSVPFMYLSDEFVEKGGLFRGQKMTKTRYQYYKNPEFLDYMKKHFKADDTLLITCRSGNRSVPASDFLAENGFNKVYNVTDGFEGGKDKKYKQRTTNTGWKNTCPPESWGYKNHKEKISENLKERTKRLLDKRGEIYLK